MQQPTKAFDKGQWVPTLCYMCYSRCTIKVEKKNGTITDIIGHPEDANSLGRLCAKGKAGIISLYDPYRVTVPLKRTNPKKGMGLDPGWQEISWEEALATIGTRLKKIREEDPRKLVLQGMDFLLFAFYNFFASAFGTPNIWKGGADYFCGNALHPITYLTQGAFYGEVDLDYCRYCLLLGTQYGFMARTTAVGNASRMAEARARGMKVVMVDPVGTNGAAKADEWIPIRPGTDLALALGILNLLLNEYGFYDREFLERYTNAGYLIQPDGYYLREATSQKPLVWDKVAEKAFPYDLAEGKSLALEGCYRVEGLSCRPAFQLLKEQVSPYTPEVVSKITTVPEETIRHLAREFGETATIGSKITIQGRELPFRPVVALWTRGAITHKHAMMTGMAIQLLNLVVGALDVPGGMLGSRTRGPFWEPTAGPDGMIVPDERQLVEEPAYPARKARAPETLELRELFPVSPYAAPLFEEAVLHPEKYEFPYGPEAMLVCLSNPIMSTSSPKRIAQVLEKIPFVVCFASHRDETTDFADIVLPEAHYLERPGLVPNFLSVGVPQGMGRWFWSMGQAVVAPRGQARNWVEVLLELAERVGARDDLYAILNSALGLKEPHRLEVGQRYTLDDMADRWACSWFGPEHGLAWFKEHGVMAFAEKKVEEVYPRPFIQGRAPIYLEYLKRAGEDLRQTTLELGIPWDASDYQALPGWRPCPGHEERSPEYDLYPVNFKVPFHTFTFSTQNPWLDELADRHPYAYKIWINPAPAKEKGIKDGDAIWVESVAGKVKGIAKVTECIHLEAVGIAGVFGHWAAGLPIAREKGVHFNTLLPSTPDRVDMVSAALDTCARVKVYKE